MGKGGGGGGWILVVTINLTRSPPPRLCCILLIPPQWQSFLFIPPFIGKDWSLIVNINVSITQRISLSMTSMLIKSIYLFLLMKFYKPFICPCLYYSVIPLKYFIQLLIFLIRAQTCSFSAVITILWIGYQSRHEWIFN